MALQDMTGKRLFRQLLAHAKPLMGPSAPQALGAESCSLLERQASTPSRPPAQKAALAPTWSPDPHALVPATPLSCISQSFWPKHPQQQRKNYIAGRDSDLQLAYRGYPKHEISSKSQLYPKNS